jgi:inner membrane transporter RhtA
LDEFLFLHVAGTHSPRHRGGAGIHRPIGRGHGSVGIAFSLAAAGFWALYIVFGQRAGSAHGGRFTAVGTLVGALFIVPFGVAHAGWTLFAPALLPVACTVAVLSSALPYSLEMYAMNRVPTRTFGVFMSLDPAVGALSGLLFLHETLSAVQWIAIASIMLATAGSAATSRDAAAR